LYEYEHTKSLCSNIKHGRKLDKFNTYTQYKLRPKIFFFLYSDNDELEYIFCAPLDKVYECPVCSNVLRYPVLFEECGHRCCASCLPELLR
jgi:hypothetical protein